MSTKTATIIGLIAIAGIASTIGLIAYWVHSAPVRAAKAAIEKDLRDPASVQYRGVRVSGTLYACGEVNAKNAMGGYVGFTRFVSSGTEDAQVYFDAPDIGNDRTGLPGWRAASASLFRDRWEAHCRQLISTAVDSIK